MRHLTETVIADEHRALRAVLRSMSMLLSAARRDGKAPDFGLLRAMLFYVDEFPERLHHTKEDALLFPRIRARCPEMGPVLDRLGADHERGEAAIRDLGHTLMAYEMMGEPRREAFEQALERYIEAYLSHMSTEETQIMPAARQHLTEADWAELDAAFATNRDPLTGHEAQAEYEPLFRRILMTAPAPIGLG